MSYQIEINGLSDDLALSDPAKAEAFERDIADRVEVFRKTLPSVTSSRVWFGHGDGRTHDGAHSGYKEK